MSSLPLVFPHFIFLKNLDIYFWLRWVFIAERALFSCGKWGPLSSCNARASHCAGFSCRAQAPGAGASAVAGCGLSICGS